MGILRPTFCNKGVRCGVLYLDIAFNNKITVPLKKIEIFFFKQTLNYLPKSNGILCPICITLSTKKRQHFLDDVKSNSLKCTILSMFLSDFIKVEKHLAWGGKKKYLSGFIYFFNVN